MSGKNPRLNPLGLRKRMLIAESELNRAQLLGDISALTADAQTLADRAKSFGSLAALTAMLTAFLRGQPVGTNPKSSWLQTLLKGAGLVSNLWLVFRPLGRKSGDKLRAAQATRMRTDSIVESP